MATNEELINKLSAASRGYVLDAELLALIDEVRAAGMGGIEEYIDMTSEGNKPIVRWRLASEWENKLGFKVREVNGSECMNTDAYYFIG